MMEKNRLIMEFGCDARNEAVARVVVAAMMTRTNPTLSEVEDVKTAVSEAVTNSIIHGYGLTEGNILLETYIEGRTVYITVTDHGCGIDCAAAHILIGFAARFLLAVILIDIHADRIGIADQRNLMLAEKCIGEIRGRCRCNDVICHEKLLSLPDDGLRLYLHYSTFSF